MTRLGCQQGRKGRPARDGSQSCMGCCRQTADWKTSSGGSAREEGLTLTGGCIRSDMEAMHLCFDPLGN